MSRVPGRLAPWLQWGACVALAAAVSLAGLVVAAPARARPEPESESPRLRLAIDHPARPGEKIALHWEGADESIRELEILMSVDGGMTYEICISPSMDPATGSYVWTVPDLGVGHAWLRIRYNRDGREIEGEPTHLTTFLRRGLDLPEASMIPRGTESERERERERAPRAGSASSLRSAEGEVDVETLASRRPLSATIETRVDQTTPRPFQGVDASRVPPVNSMLLQVPLRN